MSVNKVVATAEFQQKLINLFESCKTREQFKAAGKYLELAKKAGYIHDFRNFDCGFEDTNVLSTRSRNRTC